MSMAVLHAATSSRQPRSSAFDSKSSVPQLQLSALPCNSFGKKSRGQQTHCLAGPAVLVLSLSAVTLRQRRHQRRCLGRSAQRMAFNADAASAFWRSAEAFMITTDGSDRLGEALNSLAKLSSSKASKDLLLRENTKVRIFERDVEDGARGCYTSHLSIYREALSKNELETALIFEDNLSALSCSETSQVTQPTNQPNPYQQAGSLVDILTWAEENKGSWDVLHISFIHSAASLRIVPVVGQKSLLPQGSTSVSPAPVVRIERTAPDWYGFIPIEKPAGLGTTAYLISRKAMTKLVELDDSASGVFNGVAIDEALASRFEGSTFGAYPVLAHRGRAPSLINPGQELFRALMYDPAVFTAIEKALFTTGLSSSQLVCAFLAFLATWTVVVVVPVVKLMNGSP